MHSPQPKRTRLPVAIVRNLILALILSQSFFIQSSSAVQSGADETEQRLEFKPGGGIVEKVRIGFDGRLKLGHFSPVSFYFSDRPAKEFPDSFAITCRDGEDTPVTIAGKLLFSSPVTNIAQGWIRPGRNHGTIKVRLFKDEAEVSSFEIPVEAATAINLPATQPLIVVVEPATHLAVMIAQSIIDDDDLQSEIVSISDVEELPLTSYGYDGVKTVVLPASAELPQPQVDSLRKWVGDGGDLIFLAESGSQFPKEGVGSMIPGTVNGETEIGTSGLERMAKSDEALVKPGSDRLKVANLENITGEVGMAEEQTPLIVRGPFEFGQVTYVAIDLTSDRFAQWPGTRSLIRQVMDHGRERKISQRTESSSVTHSGYRDISGQLRVPLDQFSKVKFVSFTLVALAIGLFILCVGPGDYFLLKKVIGRMELTWITLTLMTLAFCAIAWMVQRYAKPSEIQVNTVEVVDIDATSRRARGTIWANVYSPSTKLENVQIAERSPLGFEIDSDVLTWHGLPGNGLGGMQNVSTAALARQKYTTRMNPGARSILEDVPFQVASSRAFFGRWNANIDLEIQSDLTFDIENQATAQLKGTLTNPFKFRLINCKILHREWVYVLDNPLEFDGTDGETIALGAGETTEKSVVNYFSRRVRRDDKGTTSAWDPGDTDLNRIVDVMMFYELAGGRKFTGLTGNYQTYIDMSYLPSLNRAVLVGEIEAPPTGLLVGDGTDPVSRDKQLTIVRIILPVDTSGKR